MPGSRQNMSGLSSLLSANSTVHVTRSFVDPAGVELIIVTDFKFPLHGDHRPSISRTQSKLPFDRCPRSRVNDRHPALSMGIKKLTVSAYKDQFSVAVTIFTPTGYSY